MMSTAEILKGLGLSAINAGGSTGAHWWASGRARSAAGVRESGDRRNDCENSSLFSR